MSILLSLCNLIILFKFFSSTPNHYRAYLVKPPIWRFMSTNIHETGVLSYKNVANIILLLFII